MTCRTSALNWIDVLYNSVRKTPGARPTRPRSWLTAAAGRCTRRRYAQSCAA